MTFLPSDADAAAATAAAAAAAAAAEMRACQDTVFPGPGVARISLPAGLGSAAPLGTCMDIL